ncbi:hypothetical protein C2I36_11600 [Rhodobacteraceae bacterium WD3A24]|nr:hypothetical protein C2I36_11600 [Rhodobacteraceae bacterium WD3A24]
MRDEEAVSATAAAREWLDGAWARLTDALPDRTQVEGWATDARAAVEPYLAEGARVAENLGAHTLEQWQSVFGESPLAEAVLTSANFWLLLAVAGLLLLGRMLAAAVWRGRRHNDCRWRRERFRPGDGRRTRWVCTDCGAEGVSRDGRPPVTCRRPLRAGAV